jgi:hypothetical protein
MKYQHQSYFYLPIIAVFGICAALIGNSMLNHDTSWYLISTRWWLDGVKIYEEIFELNPPLAFYLTVPPVYIAGILGLSSVTAMKIYVLILSLISVLWGRRVLSKNHDLPEHENTIISIAASIALLIVPLESFAQREHFMVILAWPYIATMLAGPKNMRLLRRELIVIGLFSGIGFALKPYFFAIPIAVTLTQSVLQRSVQPVFSIINWALLTVCIVYVLASYVLHPEYFTQIIPQTVLTYGAYEMSSVNILRTCLSAFAVMLVSAYLIYRLRKPYYGAAWVLMAASLGGIISYLMQSKGWIYQLMPFKTLAVIYLTWLFLGLYADRNQKWIAAAVAILPIYLFIVPALLQGPYKNPIAKELAQYFTCPAGQRTYQVFASNVYPSFPLGNYANAIPSNRAPALWLFPGVIHQLTQPIKKQQREYLSQILDAARTKVIADFTRTKPQLLIVDTHPEKAYFKGTKFDYINFMLKDDRFKSAWPDYVLAGEVGGFQIYRREGCDVPAEIARAY